MAKSEIMTVPARRSLSPLIWPSLAAAIAFAILVGLGLWQLERLAWKQKLLADMQERLQANPVALPDPRDWPMLTQDKNEFRRVRLRASFSQAPRAYVYAGAPALRTDLASPGYFVFAPAHLAGDEMIVVNLGWLPLDRINEGNAPNGEIAGYLRWPESGSLFIADHDAAGEIWFTRDPHAMAALRSWGESRAPFYIDMVEPLPADGWPKPGPLAANLRNNHLGYALTWFGLAATLLGVFAAWLHARSRKDAEPGRANRL